MKKFLLVLVPAVLLLTSCLGDGGNDDPVLPEAIFCKFFMIMNSHGENAINVVDKLISVYEEDNEAIRSAITVSDNGDGTATFTVDFDNIGSDTDAYSMYRGSVVVTLSGITSTLSDATSKVIDMSSLQFYDGTYICDYDGEITIIGNGGGIGSKNITYSNFSFALAGSVEKLWTIENYNYVYSYNESSKISTWSEGDGVGTHGQYGTFSVSILSDIVKNGNLQFFSSGTYVFRVQAIGNGAYFTVEYGKGGNAGAVTITATDGSVYELSQVG